MTFVFKVLVDVFEKFRNMFKKICELDPEKFHSVPGLAWQAALKKTKVKVGLLTDIDALIIITKGIRRGIYYSIYEYPKTNSKYIKDFESSYIQYWNVNNLYGWAMSQKLPVNNLNGSKILLNLIKISQKYYNEENDEGYLFEVDSQYLEKLHELHNDLPFLPDRIII